MHYRRRAAEADWSAGTAAPPDSWKWVAASVGSGRFWNVLMAGEGRKERGERRTMELVQPEREWKEERERGIWCS